MAIFQESVIVIIGGYSTGRLFPYLFRGIGYECIHINSHPHMPDYYTFGYSDNKHLYLEDISYKDMPQLLDDLKKYKIKCVIPGTESGVQLADELIERLGLHQKNDFRFSLARRNKFLMQNALKEKNINHIPSFIVSNQTSLLQSAAQMGYPLVLKPPASSDAEGVTFCYDETQLLLAFNSLVGKKDLYDQDLSQLLLQKKMEGTEFVVNTVSWNGRHFITDVWSNIKLKDGFIYDYQDLINPYEGVGIIISSYIRSVLDALGISYGASHSELIMTKSGPVLIEIGARVHGDFAPSCTMAALGYNQLSVMAQVYLYEECIDQYFDELEKRPIKKASRIVSMISNAAGTINNVTPVDRYYQLKSFFAKQHSFKPGKKLYATESLMTSPGNLYLVANNPEQLVEDYSAIREYEKCMYHKMLE